ncbi:MAG: type II secretion system protein [Parcubacteria group bacterium]|nr:type II secretion system protein [Parcubacteria group bacterium]
MNKQRGFTLIELLVVVAIIGMLASTVLIGLSPARKMGRDARRVSDMRNMQNVLELFYSKYGVYPNNTNNNLSDWASLGTLLSSPTVGLLQVIPTDPSPGTITPYKYGATNNGAGYVMSATLESSNNAVLANDIDGANVNGSGVSCDDPTYCVVNP